MLLWRTSVPSLDLGGFDPHRYFTAREISRASSYSEGELVLWLAHTAATLSALIFLIRRVPGWAAGIGLKRIGRAIIVGMVMLVALWAVSLPFSFAGLWWQHHWGLGPFDVAAWLLSQRYGLIANVGFSMLTIVIVVGLGARFQRYWWILGAPIFIAIAALAFFTSGWLGALGNHPIRRPALRAQIARIEQAEHVKAPVSVDSVHDFTTQVNAFSAGFGPGTRVVIWDTLLDGRFSDREVDVVVAHEFGHVASRHMLKELAWFALFAFPLAFFVAEATRRRGGIQDPANLPVALLAFTVASLAIAPAQNLISRRYEAEADWRALQATHDPVSARKLFQQFARTSLEEPNPGVVDYLWLENHPTLMQRIAMVERYKAR